MRFSLLILTLGLALPAHAQDRRPSHCIAIAEAAPGIEYLHKAAYTDPVPENEVRIRYLDHSMFLIQTEGGLSAITDYNGFVGSAPFVPDVVTMNHAHTSHWTALPDPRIEHVLEGWGDGVTPVDHHLDLGEMLVRNVATDIRGYGGSVEKYGNSIFVFEVAGLCVGHLGHLHHIPDDRQFAALGRLDVVMAAVDGGTSLDLPSMIAVVQRLKSSVVLPMHWFGRGTLENFLRGVSEDFAVEQPGVSELTIGLRTLPREPTVIVLEPSLLHE